jgi:hypothetical protein
LVGSLSLYICTVVGVGLVFSFMRWQQLSRKEPRQFLPLLAMSRELTQLDHKDSLLHASRKIPLNNHPSTAVRHFGRRVNCLRVST